jgi:hypothetical protein
MTKCVEKAPLTDGGDRNHEIAGGVDGTTSCGCRGGRSPNVESHDGAIPTASTRMTFCDILGGWKARWGILRMDYRVRPGLYAVGKPDSGSAVLVTANYKLTFDAVRRELGGLDAWLLVLDTKGVNVWCAAGKGTFGTDELVERIAATDLGRHVRHRALVLPQLGATGVSAHEIKERTGWRVIWGPVLARDIRAFLAAGLKKDAKMRSVSFGLRERAVLVPMELVHLVRWIPHIAVALAVLALPLDAGYRSRLLGTGVLALASVVAGAMAFPLLLPLLPFRAFGFKGLALGVPVCVAAGFLAFHGFGTPVVPLVAVGLPAAALVVWLAMNFTGCTTFTSQTGATLEVKSALRPLAVASAIGVAIAVVHGVWRLIA